MGVIITETLLMGNRFVWSFSFVLIFALGFAAGALWRSPYDHRTQFPVPCDHRSQSAGNCDLWSQPDDDAEARIAKALEDPNFKRIHDHLTREQPVLFDFPLSSSDETPLRRQPDDASGSLPAE